ncbi:L-ornithine N5-oxygenase sida, partial [Pseudovirgaria hyperparasitica]
MAPHFDSRGSSPHDLTSSTRNHYAHPVGDGYLETTDSKDYNVSHLQYTEPDDLHDLVCVGFGPASLAIAVALHDSLDTPNICRDLPNLSEHQPKVAFLERQPSFAWHAGMLLPGAKMQISFIKDMATLRNPRSEFTFMNYLHKNGRLVEFTNLGTFLPQRVEYEDYMRWCANWFNEVVEYDQEVVQIIPENLSTGSQKVESFIVKSRNRRTNTMTERRTRNVVIAAGGRPSIPKHLPQRHPKVIHSSQYSHVIRDLFKDPQYPYRAAVIGGGQSAAEIFENLHSHYPNSQTNLIIKGAALRPSDDSPFVNEIFNPSRVDDVYHQSPALRASALAADRNTNYGVVRLDLLERIYETIYTQRIRYKSEAAWPHHILPHRHILKITDSPEIPGGVRLHIHNTSGDFYVEGENGDEVIDVDAVFVATGYRRNAHEDMLEGAEGLRPNGAHKWEVGRDYRVLFKEGTVVEDAGVWLQGCCESTHGLSDSLLSVLASRAGEMVNNIFGADPYPTQRGSKKSISLNGRSSMTSNGITNL